MFSYSELCSEKLRTFWKTLFQAQFELGLSSLEIFVEEKFSERLVELMFQRLKNQELKDQFHQITDSERKSEWMMARMGEALIREKLGENAHSSVSHSKGVVLVAGVHAQAKLGKIQVLGVGVDLESKDREVLEPMQKKFMKAELKSEESFGFLPLDLWVMKEASFKALGRQENEGHVLNDFQITKGNPAKGSATFVGKSGTFFEVLLIGEGPWKLAFAFRLK